MRELVVGPVVGLITYQLWVFSAPPRKRPTPLGPAQNRDAHAWVVDCQPLTTSKMKISMRFGSLGSTPTGALVVAPMK